MKANQKLRLDASAFVAPTHDRWLVRGASDFVSASFQHDPALPDTLLELLDGTRDSEEIARNAGLDAHEMRAVLHRLRRRHLVTSGRSFEERTAERWRWETIQPSAENVAFRPRPDVLLVGLGALGLAVLRNFLELDLGALLICDPSPVGGADVPGYFNDRDRGRPRQEAVLDYLPPSLRSRVSGVRIDTSDADAIDASIEVLVRNVTAVVACSDCGSSLAIEAGRICHHLGVPFLGAELTMSGAHIGPQLPHAPTTLDDGGCYSCEKLYKSSQNPFEWVLGQYAQRRFPNPPPWRYLHDVLALTTLSRAILLELLGALDAAHGVRAGLPRHVFVDFDNNSHTSRDVPRHYACPVCYPRQAANIQSLRQEVRRQWTDSQRSDGEPPSLSDLWHRLQRFVDSDHGLFQSVVRTTGAERQALASVFADRGVHAHDGPMIQAHRVMAHRRVVRNGSPATVTTHGLTFDDARAAEALAILEGLERLFGMGYCDPGRVVTARYSDIESIALDPRRFPLYADRQYDDPAFNVRRFDPLAPMEWVCGVRVVDDEPLLVPRDLIYGPSSGLPIYLANSSGAACHSRFVRAILNGLYEGIERDALMVAWFNRLSLPRLTLANSDRDPWQIRETFASLGFRLTHVDITSDLAIPVVLAVLEDEREKNFLMVTMATAPTREALLDKLYKELFHFCYPLLIHGDAYRTNVTRTQDPFRVVTMADHVCFYQSRRKIRHAAFLTASTEEKHFGTLPLPEAARASADELRHFVECLHHRGYDVIVVDCSVPLLRQVGLHVVKVLVPGLQPLHGGHRYAVMGGRRVFEVARLMGYADRDRTVEDLNPWPHPYW